MSRKDKLKHGHWPNEWWINFLIWSSFWSLKLKTSTCYEIYYWAESERVLKQAMKPTQRLVILLEMWKINNHSVYFLTPAAAVTICRRDHHRDCQTIQMHTDGRGGGTKPACLSIRLLRAGGGWEAERYRKSSVCCCFSELLSLSQFVQKTLKNSQK